MQVEPSIFKAYDIRGIYSDQLDEKAAYALARAYATLMIARNSRKKLRIAVGGDMRNSTPSLKERVIKGLIDSGIDVDDMGMVSTPTFYFGTAFFGYDGGVQVSASHNPKEWNGLKLVGKNASPISTDSGIMNMKKIVEQDQFCQLAGQKGKLGSRSGIVEIEADEQLKDIDVSSIKPFKIAIDAANGMGSADLEALFKQLPQCQLFKINFEPDGSFPAHAPDPTIPENTQDLRKLVVKQGCDMGIAPDGDGDRYFFVDEKGEMLPQAILRGIMALIELQEHPGAKVAYDIRPGRITKDMIDKFGGTSIVTPVGHSLIKEAMIKENISFGAESAGHYFYKRPYGTFEMPIVLTAKFLQYLSHQNMPFSEAVQPFKKYFNTGEINIKVASRNEVNATIKNIKEKYKDGNQIFLDGITVEYPDYWFNLRSSNTEPLIRLTVEAKTSELMEKKRDEILAAIKG